MTWIGLIPAICLTILAATILYITIEQWKHYQRITRVFFCLYAAYLVHRGITTLYAPVTVGSAIQMMLGLLLLFPMLICVIRLMRLGDPFLIAKLILDLREELKREKSIDARLEETSNRLLSVQEMLVKAIKP